MFSGIYFDLAHFYFMEVWKDIEGYEGLYQASSLGRIKSLGRQRIMPNGGIRIYPEKIFKPAKNKYGYLQIVLCKNCKQKSYKVHRLVWESFNGKTDLPIDHIIEGNKTDNRICNLQAITNRENSTKYVLSTKKSSKYIGVSFNKPLNKWLSQIRINNKYIYLGYYTNEIDAANAYQDALNKIK
jgi:hypothetical protein